MRKKQTYRCTKCDETITLYVKPIENPTHYHEKRRQVYTMKEVQ